MGSGGREHALGWRLASEADVHSAPGNPGLAGLGETHPVAVAETEGIVDLSRRIEPDLVVVGPEAPLIDGLADALRAAGQTVLGPDRAAARLEASKAFSKALMLRAGVPTAASATFTSADPASAFDYVRARFDQGVGVAVKASGAALGKGVVVCDRLEPALAAVESMLVAGDLGEAGREVVVEDRLVGREFSLLTLLNEQGFQSLPVAQDYKRLGDGDEGPNTGGMGSASPVPWLEPELVAEAERTVVAPVVAALGVPYRGVLFSGLMVVDGRPMCLEYNVRFGDPETQTVVRRCGAGFLEALLATARGEPIPPVETRPEAAVTVVVASPGYPATSTTGLPVEIGSLPDGVVAFHAGTRLGAAGLESAGGRVLGLSAVGPTLEAAREAAYAGVAAVRLDGAQRRADIGRF